MINELKNTIITISIPWLGSKAIAEFITQMGLGGDCKELLPPQTKRHSSPTHKVLQFTFNHYREAMAKTFVNHLATVFKENYLKVEVAKVNAFNDEWELYEHLLSTHDWYYDFSDDHRVWSACAKKIKKLGLELSYLNAPRQAALLKQYNP